jgi:hypothetical protein
LGYQPGFFSEYTMRTLLITILTCLSSFQTKSPVIGSWLIEHTSTLSINGSSNINMFTCDITEYLRSDTLWGMQDQKSSKYVFTSQSMLAVEVRQFDCHHKYITSDFRKMLKSDAYPSLVIRFLSLDEIRPGATVRGQVMVELAGKRKIMDVSYQCTQPVKDQVCLKGVKQMRFSDFELVPPKKIGGLIRINEDISVTFNLFFRKLHS